LKVDGGAVANDFLMQFQADITDVEVLRPSICETTALGAAFLAGLAVGFWTCVTELEHKACIDKHFIPHIDADTRARLYAGWQDAVARTRS
jgi:glycerol kinase